LYNQASPHSDKGVNELHTRPAPLGVSPPPKGVKPGIGGFNPPKGLRTLDKSGDSNQKP